MRRSWVVALGVVVAAGWSDGRAGAQVLTPGVNEAFSGLSSPSREAPRVFQSFIDSSFLTDVTAPVTITGLSFRLPPVAGTADAPATYPSADLVFGRYDITLAKPSAAAVAANALVSDTFADNMSGPVVVRAGALTIPAGSLTDHDAGPGPAGSAEFSFFIPFTTPYTLQPGEDLVVLVRHGGYVGVQQTNWNFDSYTYTSGGRVATGDVNAASGALIPDTVMKYALVVPEPGSLAALAPAGALALRRRRRRRRRGD